MEMKVGIGLGSAGCIALAAFVGCNEPDAPAGTGTQLTDSAGIGIVTSPTVDAVYARLAEQPALAVGELDGPEEYLFGHIASVARDGAGNLVVADSRAGEIRVFDAQGRHLRTFGGMGEGPGEFQFLSGAWPVPNGIVAVDREQQRITRFGSEGSLIATARFTAIGEMAAFTTMGMAGSGMVLNQVRDMGMSSLEESALEDAAEALEDDGASVLFLRHRLDGELVDTLARRPGEKMLMKTSGSGDMMSVDLLRVPFSRSPTAVGSPRGVAVTGGGAYEVALFGAAGELSRIARLDEAPPLRTVEHIEAHVRGSGNPFLQDDASIRAMVEMYQDMPLPDRLPGYTELLFADTGELWARRYIPAGGETAHWDVFGADGHHLGRVEVSTSFQIEEVSRGQVVGIASDDLGVQRVEVRDLSFSGR